MEWCTRKYNIKHAYEKGLNPTKKQIIEYVSKLEDRIEKLEKVIKSMEYRLGDE